MKGIEKEFGALGINVSIEEKTKPQQQVSFLKPDTAWKELIRYF